MYWPSKATFFLTEAFVEGRFRQDLRAGLVVASSMVPSKAPSKERSKSMGLTGSTEILDICSLAMVEEEEEVNRRRRAEILDICSLAMVELDWLRRPLREILDICSLELVEVEEEGVRRPREELSESDAIVEIDTARIMRRLPRFGGPLSSGAASWPRDGTRVRCGRVTGAVCCRELAVTVLPWSWEARRAALRLSLSSVACLLAREAAMNSSTIFVRAARDSLAEDTLTAGAFLAASSAAIWIQMSELSSGSDLVAVGDFRRVLEVGTACVLAVRAAISGCGLTGRLILGRAAAVIVVGDTFMPREEEAYARIEEDIVKDVVWKGVVE